MSGTPVRFVQKTKKAGLGFLELQLHVKPGASRAREGVLAIRADAVELCVSAQAREGEANKAVVELLSDVLGVPRSRLQLARGIKSRDKTVLLECAAGEAEERVREVMELLRKASE
ncbi:hypothetical protein B0I35DRAFT_476260 [Stachybotrys elegans]|uniref:Uncharacterized protein n=1 Tax=Stachybotrys elegans TaxID=80388 RepID=A0A8K0T035_9HYPO|nr:hypothetical protein B0I35DRAFT_476260 [Stachybotrys elegans]